MRKWQIRRFVSYELRHIVNFFVNRILRRFFIISLVLLSAFQFVPVSSMAKTHKVYKAVVVEEQERNQQSAVTPAPKKKSGKKKKSGSAKKKKKLVSKKVPAVSSSRKRGNSSSGLTAVASAAENTAKPKDTDKPKETEVPDSLRAEETSTYLADIRCILMILLASSGITCGINLFIAFSRGMK